jgi:hypothetical protein
MLKCLRRITSLRLLTYKTKVPYTAVGSAGKIVFDYVIRCLNALSAGSESRLRGLTFAEAPLSAISRFNWSPESTKARRMFEVPREDDSSFRADLEQSISNERAFMKFVSLTKPIAGPDQIHTYTELLQQIHDDLRIQHPEWVQPNGESPLCDSYEARLMEVLGT